MAAGQKAEGAAGANDVNRLPQAVKDKHRLIKGRLHTRIRNSVFPPPLSSGWPGH
jgi:hypothetical protein